MRRRRPRPEPASTIAHLTAHLAGRRVRLGALVVAAGVVGGLLGTAYLLMLRQIGRALGPGHWSSAAHLAVMVGVGAVVAVIVALLGPPGNVELLVDDIHVSSGEGDLRSLRSLIPVSLLCIGAGGPLGPEAPLVTTTGSVAAVMGRRHRLDATDLRIVSITGMAAGFAVLFSAPLGSAVFALEILHRRGLEYYEALLPAVVGALCGYVVSIIGGAAGLTPVWSLPAPISPQPADLAYAVGAGAAGALLAFGFEALCRLSDRLAAGLPETVLPIVGAAAISALAVATPYALTNGEGQVHHLAAAQATVGVLVLAAAGKFVASAVAVATGWRGGFIVPLFFVGFCLGRATVGHLPGGDGWLFAVGLMAATNVGVTKTPLGSTLVLTEMTGTALLPTTLIASLVSLVLSSPVAMLEAQRRRALPSNEEPTLGPAV